MIIPMMPFLKFPPTRWDKSHSLGTLNFPWSVGTRMEGPGVGWTADITLQGFQKNRLNWV